MSPFRRIVKDYFMICESYYEAIRTADAEPDRDHRHGAARPAQRRQRTAASERLNGKVEVDFDTARRLFTLVCVLHWRG